MVAITNCKKFSRVKQHPFLCYSSEGLKSLYSTDQLGFSVEFHNVEIKVRYMIWVVFHSGGSGNKIAPKLLQVIDYLLFLEAIVFAGCPQGTGLCSQGLPACLHLLYLWSSFNNNGSSPPHVSHVSNFF